MLKLHLGCGNNYLGGWINVDLNSPKADVKSDLRQSFPFSSDSIDFVFAEHLLEHFTFKEGLAFLKECRRVLKKEGVLRLSVPNIRFVVDKFLSGEFREWENMGWTPKNACHMLNESFFRWGHKFQYDKDELFSSLEKTKFTEMEIVSWGQSKYLELKNLESRPFHHELIAEARK